MAENKSDASKYQSEFGGGFITSAQYITELVCKNIAKKKKLKLTDHFWADPMWTKDYQWQIICAAKLLKVYHPSVIIAALKDPQISYKIISLGAVKSIKPALDKMQAEHLRKLENLIKEGESAPQVNEDSANQKPQRAFSTKKGDILNKLKGL